jgi:hypothetical protein
MERMVELELPGLKRSGITTIVFPTNILHFTAAVGGKGITALMAIHLYSRSARQRRRGNIILSH